jgi:hypothetical protein
VTTARASLDDRDPESLTDAWLDAAFAATREARIRRTLPSSQGATRRVMVLTGGDIAQLRSLLRLSAAAPGVACDARWMIELHNTRSRVTTLHLSDALVRVEGFEWRALRDAETLARWLDVRGFRAPFEAWKVLRGCVRSPRAG